jgi:hypothetical protein
MTDATRQAFAEEAMRVQPTTAEAAIVGLDRLIAWTQQSPFQPQPLPAIQQKTVAFGIGTTVFWRAYPGERVAHKVVLIPQSFALLPKPLNAALSAALEAAVPGSGPRGTGLLSVALERLCDSECFERFAVLLAATAAAAHEGQSTSP